MNKNKEVPIYHQIIKSQFSIRWPNFIREWIELSFRKRVNVYH